MMPDVPELPAHLEKMEAEVRRQADRLREQLATLDAGADLDLDTSSLATVVSAADELRRSLASVPAELRSLLIAAELGFMPGPGLEAFAPKHSQDRDKELASLAEGATAVISWQGKAGRTLRRNWLIRGYIRGFAHQWRQSGMGEPDLSRVDEGFLPFASRWLTHAGVSGDHRRRCRAALGKGWRVAAD